MVKPRLLLCATVLVIGASGGWGQPVPDTIMLPDSLGPLWGPPQPYHLACGGSGNIYVASESSDIMVIDGSTFQRIKRVVTNTPVNGVLLVPQHNRLYCSYPAQHRLGVVDCLTNNIVGSIQITTGGGLLCYSSTSDKLYCCDRVDNSVSVINCAADTVLKVIPVGESVNAIAYDPTANQLYVATVGGVQIISCSADSIVASIDEVKRSRGFYVSARRHKVYAVGDSWRDTLYVIATKVDTVVAKISHGMGNVLPHLACNEATDRLYGAVYDWYSDIPCIYELDCSADTFIRAVDVFGRGWDLVCDTVKNRLYYLNSDFPRYLTTYDCGTLGVLQDRYVEPSSAALVLDQNRGRVLCPGGEDEGLLAVFDCQRDSLNPPLAVVPLAGRQWSHEYGICNNSVSHKLYYRWGDGVGGVGVIDELTNRVVKQVMLPQHACGDLAYSPTSNKLYCGCGPGLAILDGSTDSLLKYDRGLSPEVMCWCPDSNRLFCFCWPESGMYLAVLDCRTDSVIKKLDVYHRIYEFEYLDNGLLLCVGNPNLTLIDCRRDTVIAEAESLGGDWPVAHTGDGKKIYKAAGGRLEVVDAHSLALIDTVGWPYSGNVSGVFLACSDSAHKLYWVAGDSALAVDTRRDTVTARLGSVTRDGCFGSSGRYLFCPGFEDSMLTVLDADADTVAAVYPTLGSPMRVASNPEQGLIYAFFWCGDDKVLVYPDTLVSGGVCEEAAPVSSWPRQTVVRGSLFLPEAAGLKPQAASLLDAAGRKVIELHSGTNDVRALAPGVYFIRGPKTEDGRPGPAVRKVVVTK